MIFLEIYPNKNLKKPKDEETFITENLISSFHIKLPSTFGDYKTSDLECEMRVYLPTGDYMAYDVPTSSSCQEVPITNDITGTVQTVKIMFIFSKNGNVIGKTNSIEKQILDAPIKGDPLTPREEFDEVIREQRETISEQAETITTQGQTITQQGEQITELNGEVTELTNENGELKTQHTADQNTIQYLIDNPPEAHLQPKSVTPTNQMQVVEPDKGYQGLSTVTVGATTPPRLQSKQVAPSMSTSYVTADNGYDGLSSVTVDNVDASIDSDIQPENIKEGVDILGVEGTYNPFPEHSVGGIYITEVDEDGYPVRFLIKNYERPVNDFPKFFETSTRALTSIFEFTFENCPNITSLVQAYFENMTSLKNIVFPSNIKTISGRTFNNTGLTGKFKIPDTVDSISLYSLFGTTTLTEIELPYEIITQNETATQRFASGAYIEKVTFSKGIQRLNAQTFIDTENLKTLFLPNSLTNVHSVWIDGGGRKLENVTLENGFNCSISLSMSTRYSHDTILSWFNALADRTGQTAYTLTIGTTNLNKMTAEEKAIAINKNWNLA